MKRVDMEDISQMLGFLKMPFFFYLLRKIKAVCSVLWKSVVLASLGHLLASLLMKELVDEDRLQDVMMQIDGTEETLSPDTGHWFCLEVQSPLRQMYDAESGWQLSNRE